MTPIQAPGSDRLISPHGGALVDLLVDSDRAGELRAASRTWPSWDLTARQLCDVELLLTGGFSPLAGFMSRADYESVCSSMRLAGGTLWPMPITLDVPESFATTIGPGASIALRDPEGVMLAALHVEEVWAPDRGAEAQAVFGTTDRTHPGVAAIAGEQARWAIGGRLEGIRLPVHYDFQLLRRTPAALRAEFRRLGCDRVVAFQTRNPLHRAHRELTLRAAHAVNAHLLIHPVVGMTKPGDVDHYTRVRCYQRLLATYPPDAVTLSLLPLAMRMGGPREAMWHAIIRKNHGCTHFIVGRDHAGPGKDSNGRPFYGPYAAQELLRAHQHELGVTMVPFREMTYLADEDRYVPEDEVPPGSRVLQLSGTELRRRLADGRPIPEWFTFPNVAAELQRTHRPRSAQGITIFFTGLSGSGKSTIANVLLVKFLELGGRAVTMLDGDLVRKHLSSELGFSKEHRDLNIRRIGFVASEITKNGGIAICAPIAPYDSVRKEVRSMIEPVGGFVLVYLSTPLEVCEQRDRKGLYAKARAGLVQQFTGISDPYEVPQDADLVLETTDMSPEQAANTILVHLAKQGYIDLTHQSVAAASIEELEASA
jgi:sulfate adenylyltransferase